MAFAPTWAGGFTFGNSRTSDKFIDGKAQMRVAVKTVSDGYSGCLLYTSIYPFFEKYFEKGIMIGGVKG